MKKILKTFVVAAAAALLGAGAMTAQDKLLAFPGAEGFGRYATGGRGGTVYHVTNLNDSGTGSFRDAVSGSNRIIVFDVSGNIQLKSALVVKGNNTILGQTAPGEGVNVWGDRISFSGANNLIVRHMRFRMGSKGTSGADACGIANGGNMIFDHLSVLWGRDENFSVNWDNKGDKPHDITIQNSIIGQGLQPHSCGGLIQTTGGVTIYRNLYIDNKTRNVKAKGLNQYVNNVIYNWGDGGAYIQSDSEGDSWAQLEGNYFIKGPWKPAVPPFSRGIQTFRFYGNDNMVDNSVNGVLDGVQITEEEMLGSYNGTAPYSTPFPSLEALNANITEYNATSTEQISLFPELSEKMSANDALSWIIENVGPVLPVRDNIDQQIIGELTSFGKLGPVNGYSSEVEIYPHRGVCNLSEGAKPLDSDGDGIPDAWEIANGLNPNDPGDATLIAANGYANIENWANSIVEAFPYIKKPMSLAVTKQNKNSLEISWDLNGNTEAGFEVEISTDGINFTKVADVAAGTTAYTIEGLSELTPYWVRLRAADGKGVFSVYSNEVATETISDPMPPYVSTLTAPALGAKEGIANGVELVWDNKMKDFFGTVKYTVYFGQDAENLAAVATDITAKSYKVAADALEAYKTYYWRVDAKNDEGTTAGEVWNFQTTAGGVLFYTDFHSQPEAVAEKWGNVTANTDLFNAANKSVECAGMTIGSGENKIRVLIMPGLCSDNPNNDYGPATADDAGATPYAIQFNTTSAGGYMTLPEVEGPVTLTLWLGNPGTSQATVKLITMAGGEETTQNLVIGAKKRVFKHTITYTNSGPVQFKLDANAKKFDVNDVLIERWVAPSGDEPLELTQGSLVNDNISYADGSLTLTFNQEVKLNSAPAITGTSQFENIDVTAAGNKVNVSYDALNVNSNYVVKFANGVLTNLTGDQSFIGELKLNTADFGPAKAAGETHYGKQAMGLPLDFAPFNTVALFTQMNGEQQTKANDYPHWVQYSTTADIPGEATEDHVTITTKNDKIMGLWDGQSKEVYLNMVHEGEGEFVLKVQESRNCDVAPGWRTIRTFNAKDLPFKGTLPLNPETRMIKVSAPTISGGIRINALEISDAEGHFAGVENVTLDALFDNNAPFYNVFGQRVSESYRGIVIQNGKKFIRK